MRLSDDRLRPGVAGRPDTGSRTGGDRRVWSRRRARRRRVRYCSRRPQRIASPVRGTAERFVTMEMQDRAVVVTGGASGIGKATALLLAREGAVVFVGDVDETGGRAVAAQAAGEGVALG